MANARFTKRAPSGNVLTASWRGKAVGSHVCGVRFVGGSVGRGFQVHPRGAHAFAVELAGGSSSDQRVLVGRNEVRVSTMGNSTTATLIGRQHELMTIFEGPAPARERIAEIFGVLDIDDNPRGMRVAPSRSSMISMAAEHIVFISDDFASMDAPGAANADRLVPRDRGRGRPTEQGEVWRNRVPGRSGNRAQDFSYIVGTPRGAVEVLASDPGAISETALLDLVESLDISWGRG